MIKIAGVRAGTLESKLAATIAAGLLLAGCGNSTHLLGTGGASSTSNSASTNPTNPQSSQPQKAASRRFVFQVNVVCRTVRQGAPGQLTPPYTTAKVSRYGSQAQSAARRTLVSLQRLVMLGSGHAGDLLAVVAGYEQLSGTYAAAAALARNASEARHLGAAIQQQEQAVTATARSAGFPACGVSGG
jgi:outer membrane murein-binding lipoprotein Lpp